MKAGEIVPVRADAAGRQFATFFVGGLFFGIDVMDVQEVLRYQTMTTVPLAPGMVEGLINLRGRLSSPSICGAGWGWSPGKIATRP